ncbi:MAG: hypothetical protein OEW75_07370 [Cyclobacteriaceae bacterium]|nr:hypothetical protein [Cyclobacteriaceae bacterium]
MKKLFAVGFISSFVLSGCFNELKDLDKIKSPELDPLLEFPVVDSHVIFSDFDDQIPDFTVGTRSDGTTTLYFEKELYKVLATDYYSFLPQASQTVTLTGFTTTATGSASGSVSSIMQIGTTNNESLETVELNAGTLEVSVFSDFVNTDVTITIRISSLTINAVALEQTFTVAVGQNNFNIDLAGAILNLSNGPSGFNQLPFDVDVSLSANGTPVTAVNKADVKLSILNPVFKMLYGTAGQQTFENRTGVQSINVLGNTTATEFSIEEPKVEVEIINSFGVPFNVSVNSFGVKDQQGNTTLLTGAAMTSLQPYSIGAPIPPNQFGESVTSTITIDHTNSNLKDVFSKIPVEINYDASAEYPGGPGKIFVLDASQATVTARAEIPLYGRLNNLYFEKQLNFAGDFFANITQGELIITTRNRFPMNIGIVMEFFDSGGNSLEQLFISDPLITESPVTDVGGRTSTELVKETIVVLDPNRLTNLSNSAQLKMYITFTTEQGGAVPVRFTDQDYLDLHIGIKGRAKI